VFHIDRDAHTESLGEKKSGGLQQYRCSFGAGTENSPVVGSQSTEFNNIGKNDKLPGLVSPISRQKEEREGKILPTHMKNRSSKLSWRGKLLGN